MSFKYVYDTLKSHLVEKYANFTEDEETPGQSLCALGIVLLAMIIAISIYVWATFAVMTCKGLQTPTKIIIFLSYHIFPGIMPLAFILYTYFAKSC